MYPDDLKYTTEHEWVRSPGETEGSVRVGITHYAQDALGDIVYVSLPEVGEELTAGSTCGELESTKSRQRSLRAGLRHGRGPQRGPRRDPRAGQQRPVRRRLALRRHRQRRQLARRAAGLRGVPGDARGLTQDPHRRRRPARSCPLDHRSPAGRFGATVTLSPALRVGSVSTRRPRSADAVLHLLWQAESRRLALLLQLRDPPAARRRGRGSRRG